MSIALQLQWKQLSPFAAFPYACRCSKQREFALYGASTRMLLISVGWCLIVDRVLNAKRIFGYLQPLLPSMDTAKKEKEIMEQTRTAPTRPGWAPPDQLMPLPSWFMWATIRYTQKCLVGGDDHKTHERTTFTLNCWQWRKNAFAALKIYFVASWKTSKFANMWRVSKACKVIKQSEISTKILDENGKTILHTHN